MRTTAANSDNDDNYPPWFDTDTMADDLIDGIEAMLADQPDPDTVVAVPRTGPVVRLVKSLTTEPPPAVPVEDDNLVRSRPPHYTDTPTSTQRARGLVQTALPGTVGVIVAAVVVTAGQPAVVAVPIDLYASSWVGVLWWNAAHRPPLCDLAAVRTALTHTIDAVIAAINARRGTTTPGAE